MKTRDGRTTRPPARRPRALVLFALLIAGQSGCGREFFREWANQDVSEAVFEKSRDPRWRIDLFSVEPPALSRFGDPYDPDRPPAPPDDYAAQSLSPVPQNPDNRLLIPAEGTAYLDMLEEWNRNRPQGAPRASAPPPPAYNPNGGTDGPNGGLTTPAPFPPMDDLNSPFSNRNISRPEPPPPSSILGPAGPLPGPAPSSPIPPALPSGPLQTPPGAGGVPGAGANLGTDGGALSPISQENVSRATDAAPRVADPTESPTARRPRDLGVTLSAFQQSGLPLPTQPDAPTTPVRPRADDIVPPSIGMDPKPGSDNDLGAPVNPRPDLEPGQYRASEALASELTSILVPQAIDFNEAEAAGLPVNSTPYVLNMQQAFTLALINSRVYQLQVENVYAASLAVTLQRFNFTPQFYAGMSPSTGVAGRGIPSPNASNIFTYQTRETGQPVSALNLGTVAGVGKAFSTGAQLAAGFANQVVFNFIGKNSVQPSVRSYLPLTLFQPFLRGAGRAVILESLTQAERNLLYQVRAFAKFRQEFIVTTLVGGQIPQAGAAVAIQGFSGGGNSDPTTGFLNLIEDLQLVENSRRNIAAYEQFVTVYKELVKGESSGLSQLQLDQVDSSLQGARSSLVGTRTTYRSDLDSFKMQMGLPPDTPIIPDRSLGLRFKQVYDEVDEWQRNPRRDLEDLPRFAQQLPHLQDIVIDGRSVLGVYKEGKNNEDELDDLLIAAERVALQHRLDIMNTRAQLYDSWRQIKVAANALQGIFNVTLTNQFITPLNTTNPFGFVDQAKNFSLVINAELPLVRLAERNTFRTALINYERQRRALMNAEDQLKLNIRNDVRTLHQLYLVYEIARRNFVLQIRVKDQAFEQIIAPPAAGAAAQGAVQTNNLISAQGSLIQVENQLIQNWYNYQVARLALYRDLGTLPYDEWEAFYELFPSESVGPDASAPGGPAGSAGAPAAGADVGDGGPGDELGLAPNRAATPPSTAAVDR